MFDNGIMPNTFGQLAIYRLSSIERLCKRRQQPATSIDCNSLSGLGDAYGGHFDSWHTGNSCCDDCSGQRDSLTSRCCAGQNDFATTVKAVATSMSTKAMTIMAMAKAIITVEVAVLIVIVVLVV